MTEMVHWAALQSAHCNAPQTKALQSGLSNLQSSMSAVWLRETTSTNDVVAHIVASSCGETRCVVAADHQSQGRGTRGRTWHEPGQMLMMTVVVPLPCAITRMQGVTLALGAACQQVLMADNPAVRMKWPNDMWVQQRKIGGILCETCQACDARTHLAVGIGVNIALFDCADEVCAQYPIGALLPARLPQKALERCQADLAARLAWRIERVVEHFCANDLIKVARLWPKIDALAGRKVIWTSPQGISVEGYIGGVAFDGSIIIDTATRQYRFSDGSLRAAPTS